MRKLVVVMIAALVLAALGSAGGTRSVSAATNKVHRGGTLTLLCASPNTSMDPAESKSGPDCDEWAYGLLYDSLLKQDDSGNLHPDLATKWTISDQGTAYTFDLRHGVTFTDGTPLNAAAVKFNLQRYQTLPASGLATYLKPITSITTEGDYTVKVTLSQPEEALLPELAGRGAGIVSPTAVSNDGQSFTLKGGGSGPFILKSWTPGGKATFTRNPHYWQKGADGKSLPYLDGVVINNQSESSVALLDLKSGSAAYDDQLDPTDIATAQSDKNLSIVHTNLVVPYMLVMNVSKPPFNNLMLRQAIQSALDRSAVMNTIGFGVGYVAPMPISKSAWYYAAKPSPTYSLATARKDLRAAGYPNGLSASFSIIDRSPDTQIAQIVQSQLAKIGVKLTIQVLERTTWVNTWTSKQGEIGLLRSGGGPTSPPSSVLTNMNPSSSGDFAAYSSPEMSSLIQQLSTTTNQAQQKALMIKIQKLLIADAPYVTFGNLPLVAAQLKTVHGVDGTLYSTSQAWMSASSG